jgi:hypothetical protein
MRIFILSTGRTGTTTLYKACRHIKNYTCGHESNRKKWYSLEYPDNHIEIDNRLSWFKPELEKNYPTAMFVHLTRNTPDVINSFKKRSDRGIIKSFIEGVLQSKEENMSDLEIELSIIRYIQCINKMCTSGRVPFLFDIKKYYCFFPQFCEWINANVDMNKALKEFETHYNKS